MTTLFYNFKKTVKAEAFYLARFMWFVVDALNLNVKLFLLAKSCTINQNYTN